MNRFVACLLAVAIPAFASALERIRILPVVAQGPTKPLPVDDPKQAAIVLLDDQADPLITHLNNDNDFTAGHAPATAEEVDVYSGATSLRVSPQQRFCGRLPGWSYPIREKPQAGEFRYVRFAWKKVGGSGIMVQMHDAAKTWCARYHAGSNIVGWESKSLTETVPTEWTVVTRDLFADFGDLTLTGMAFTAMDGQYGLFDHVLLGRTEADLDAKSDELLGKTKPKDKLDGKARAAAWDALGGRDWEKAGPAVRAFLSAAPDQVGFVREQLAEGAPNAAREKALRAKAAELVARLGDDDFDVRLAAEAELEKLRDAAREEIVEAANSPNPEVAFRAKGLTARLKFAANETPLSAVRAARTARVLERAGSADAKKLLGEMSAGDFGPFHATAAKAALTRMK